MKPSSERLGLIVLIAGAMIIGLTPILVRLSQAGPAATGFWRLAFAAPLLAVMTALERTPADATPGAGRFAFAPIMLGAGVMFAGDMAFWHYGLHLTSVANATVLSNGTPIIVTAVAWLVLKERPRGVFLVGMALAVGGAVTMALARGGGPAAHRASLLGDGLSVFAAVWYAGYFLAVREARKRAGVGAVMFWSSLAGLPILAVIALVLREPFFPMAAAGWVACIGLGLTHVAGQGAIAWALGRVPTALASVAVLVQPVVAAVLGWIVFGEAITPLQGLGALIALAGVALAQSAGRAMPPPEP